MFYFTRNHGLTFLDHSVYFILWIMSDVVERPCGQLSPSEQAISSQTEGERTANSPGVPLEHANYPHPSSSDQIAKDKYISDRDLPQPRTSSSDNVALRTVACATFYVVLFAVFRAAIRPAFWHGPLSAHTTHTSFYPIHVNQFTSRYGDRFLTVLGTAWRRTVLVL